MSNTATARVENEADYSIYGSAEVIPFNANTASMRDIANNYETRESWLNAAVNQFRPIFDKIGKPLPERILVSIGFPSTGRAKRVISEEGDLLAGRIAEYWYPENEGDAGQIYITPQLPTPLKILGVLAHELCHGSAGKDAKHGPKFKEVADALGLVGKMTSALPGDELNTCLQVLADELGPMPHEQIIVASTGKKTQTTRLIRVESTCLDDENGKRYNANMSQKWIDEAGAPICPTALRNYLEMAIELGEKITPQGVLDAMEGFRMIVVERKKKTDKE